MGSNNSRHRREQRREDANERLTVYDKLTVQRKIDALDRVLGQGQGATRQRARLGELLNPTSNDTKRGSKTGNSKRERRKGRNKQKHS